LNSTDSAPEGGGRSEPSVKPWVRAATDPSPSPARGRQSGRSSRRVSGRNRQGEQGVRSGNSRAVRSPASNERVRTELSPLTTKRKTGLRLPCGLCPVPLVSRSLADASGWCDDHGGLTNPKCQRGIDTRSSPTGRDSTARVGAQRRPGISRRLIPTGLEPHRGETNMNLAAVTEASPLTNVSGPESPLANSSPLSSPRERGRG
jgi:hypothetical protein